MSFTIFPSTVSLFSLHWHQFPLPLIEYHWEDRSDQLMRKVISRLRGMLLLVSAKVWKVRSGSSPLRLREYARNPATGCPGCPSSTKWNGLYCDWQGALTSKYPVPSGPRDTKAWTFPQHLLIAIYFHLNTKNTSCSSTEIRKKKLSAVAHWTTKLP